MRVRADVMLDDGVSNAPKRVGAVSDDGRTIAFQYAPEYRASGGVSISPVLMPLSPSVFVFPELRGVEAFHGLPGVLADALPDRFGTRLMNAYFRQTGKDPGELSAVQRLLYIGRRAMGALTFSPPEGGDAEGAREPLTLALLREQARAAIEGRTTVVLREIQAAASSAGGARAKALVAWNRETGTLAFGDKPLEPGFDHWLLKFDGVGTDGGPQVWCRLEYAYARMAQAAGITTPEVALIEDGDLRHFASKRFDRDGNRRHHMTSLAGLEHLDFNVPAIAGYEVAFDVCNALDLGAPDRDELYRRMVFNVVARNQDDHPKNLAFLMDVGSGTWSLSPGYDLTYARGAGYTRTHQMTVNGKAEGITGEDLRAVAKACSVRNAGRIVDEVISAVANWPEHAAAAGVDEEMMIKCREDHQLDVGLAVPRGRVGP